MRGSRTTAASGLIWIKLPLLSDARGVAIVVKKWLRKQRLLDAIIIEHPRYAGGHPGATRTELLRKMVDQPVQHVAAVLDAMWQRQASPARIEIG